MIGLRRSDFEVRLQLRACRGCCGGGGCSSCTIGQGAAHQPTRSSTSSGWHWWSSTSSLAAVSTICSRIWASLGDVNSNMGEYERKEPVNVNARSLVSSASCTQGSRSTVHCGGCWCGFMFFKFFIKKNAGVGFFLQLGVHLRRWSTTTWSGCSSCSPNNFPTFRPSGDFRLNCNIQCTTWMDGMDARHILVFEYVGKCFIYKEKATNYKFRTRLFVKTRVKIAINCLENECISSIVGHRVDSKVKQRCEDNFSGLSEHFYSHLTPYQEVSYCFNEGTTPNFGDCVDRFIGENNFVRSCKWSYDGNWLISDSVDHFVRLFGFHDSNPELDKRFELRFFQKLPFGGLIYDLNWHPTKSLFTTTSKDSPIHCWNASSEETKLYLSFRGMNEKDELEAAYSLSFSINGQRLFAGYKNCLRIFDFERPGRQVDEIKTYQKSTIKTQKGIVASIAMCPTFDGVFAVASYSGTLGLYSTQTNACDSLIGSDDGSATITNLQYSSCGNLLFAGRRKSSFIQCYDVRLPTRLLYNFQRDSKTNQRIYFQVDSHDNYLYSGSSNGNLFIYDLKTGNKLSNQQKNQAEVINPTYKIKCSEAAVTGLSLHPHEKFLAVSTGQRLFPSNFLLNRLFDEDNSSLFEAKTEEEDTSYISRGKGSLLDNSIKLYKFA